VFLLPLASDACIFVPCAPCMATFVCCICFSAFDRVLWRPSFVADVASMGLHRGASPVFVMEAFVRVVAVAAALAADAANDGWRAQWRVRRGGGHRQDPSHIQRLPRPHPAYIVAVPVPYIQRLVSGKLPSECELLLTAVRRSSQGECCNSAQMNWRAI